MTDFIDSTTGTVHVFPTLTDANEIAAQIATAKEAGLRPFVQADMDSQKIAYSASLSPIPNPVAFISDIKTVFGGVSGILALPANVQSGIALAFAAIQLQDWADVQAYIIAFETAIGSTAYAAIKTSATTNHIPVTLP